MPPPVETQRLSKHFGPFKAVEDLTLSVEEGEVFGLLGSNSITWYAGIMNYLSLSTHFESMARGVIDSKDVIYFLSIILMGLTGTEIAISKRNLTN